MQVCCVYSLESPHRVHTIYQINIKMNLPEIISDTIMPSAIFFCQGLKSEFKIAVINKPSGSHQRSPVFNVFTRSPVDNISIFF